MRNFLDSSNLYFYQYPFFVFGPSFRALCGSTEVKLESNFP